MSSMTHAGTYPPADWLRRDGRAPLLAFAVLAVFAALAANALLTPFPTQDFFALSSNGTKAWTQDDITTIPKIS